ncbi:MAG: endolytic transglycosylase MltG [Acidobacteriota bacterium]
MRALKLLGCLVLLALLAAGAGGWWAWSTLHRPHGTGTREVLIEPGADAGTILELLERRGILPNARLARAWLVYGMDDPPLHAGEYRFEGPRTTVEVLETLARGEVLLRQVTVIEGLTLEETARGLAEAGFGREDAFLAAMRDPAPIAGLDPEAETLEGYLLPETYSFVRGASEREIVATMVRTFREALEREVRPLLGERLAVPGPEEPPPRPLDSARGDKEKEEGRGDQETGRGGMGGGSGPGGRSWTVRELVTLASLVEKEAKVDEERPLVAAVYVNRLDAGMGLYADPTVIYALKRRDAWDGNLSRQHLELDSPYNTYRYGGLPPGPIASPGLESLRAAAEPADVPHLYFVSRNDGTHVFARTLREHNANVRRWQKEYWRKRWAEQRAAPD